MASLVVSTWKVLPGRESDAEALAAALRERTVEAGINPTSGHLEMTLQRPSDDDRDDATFAEAVLDTVSDGDWRDFLTPP